MVGFSKSVTKSIVLEAFNFTFKTMNIHLKKGLLVNILADSEYCEEYNIHGHCYADELGRFPKSISLVLDDNLATEDLVRTTIHEVVHVAQMASGYLWDTKKAKYWKGKNILAIPYMEAPHEIEAYEMEDRVFHLFSKTGAYNRHVS